MSNSLIANSRGMWFSGNYEVASSQSEIILNAPFSATQVVNYVLYWDDVSFSITDSRLRLRMTKSGTAVTTGNYNFVKAEKHNSAPVTSTSQDGISLNALPFQTPVAMSTGVAYIYNVPLEQDDYMYIDETITGQGSVDGNRCSSVLTLQTASDGISISCTSGTIETGKFRLYGYGLDS